MTKYPTGKGEFLWNIIATCGGDPFAIAARAQELKLDWVALKVADGVSRFNQKFTLKGWVDLAPAVVQALRAVGIKIYGWGYIYGKYPAREAQAALERIGQLKLDGWIVDAEQEFQDPASFAAAVQYMTTLRTAYPALPLGLSSYRFPANQPAFVWAAFLKFTDFVSPQVYWALANNPVEQLTKSLAGHQKLFADLGLPMQPFIPTGAAYQEAYKVNGKSISWRPTLAEVQAFQDAVQAQGMPGICWWVWEHADRYGFNDVIARQTWAPPVVIPDPVGTVVCPKCGNHFVPGA
jgi:hypothetical protein